MNLNAKIELLRKAISQINIFRSVLFNLKMFPINTAVKMPILLGYHVDIRNIRRGNIILTKVKMGGVRIGINNYPMKSSKSKYTMIRSNDRKAKLTLGGDNIKIYQGVSIVLGSSISLLQIGNDVMINQDTIIYCGKKILIGDHTRIGWDSQIYDTNFHFMYDEGTRSIAKIKREVVIGNNVWLANHVTVARASIPPYSTVASHSLVNKDFSSIKMRGNIFIGCPAILKKTGVFRILSQSMENKLTEWFDENKEDRFYCDENFEYKQYLKS